MTPEIQEPDPTLADGWAWVYKPNSNERIAVRVSQEPDPSLEDGWAWVYKPNSNERVAVRVCRYGSHGR